MPNISFRPEVEALEDRLLLSVFTTPAGAVPRFERFITLESLIASAIRTPLPALDGFGSSAFGNHDPGLAVSKTPVFGGIAGQPISNLLGLGPIDVGVPGTTATVGNPTTATTGLPFTNLGNSTGLLATALQNSSATALGTLIQRLLAAGLASAANRGAQLAPQTVTAFNDPGLFGTGFQTQLGGLRALNGSSAVSGFADAGVHGAPAINSGPSLHPGLTDFFTALGASGFGSGFFR